MNDDERFKMAASEIHEWYKFFNDSYVWDDLKIKPLRLCTDSNNKYIYSQLMDFQKANTFVLFNKNSPEKILGYILFAPTETLKFPTPRVISWKLSYCYGRYLFSDLYGRLGMEFLFGGVKGPKLPIDIKKELGEFVK